MLQLKRSTLLIALAFILTIGVIGLGAYVRLSDAGLGCPDWPGCYGHISVSSIQDHAAAGAAFDKPVETHKAWKEMIHRYFAGTLGLLILAIFISAWNKQNRQQASPLVPSVLLVTVLCQALLGMWTVTLLLKPVIVTLHLLGGMTTMSLLLWLLVRRNMQPLLNDRDAPKALRHWALLALIVVVIQIALGGWVSSNYAALMCPEFPACRGGEWLPTTDFASAFQLHRELGHTADGALLGSSAMTAIHISHRIGAVIVLFIVGGLGLHLLRHRELKGLGIAVLATLLLQISLGIANVLTGLKLHVAVSHNVVAALLLATIVIINALLTPRSQQRR